MSAIALLNQPVNDNNREPALLEARPKVLLLPSPAAFALQSCSKSDAAVPNLQARKYVRYVPPILPFRKQHPFSAAVAQAAAHK